MTQDLLLSKTNLENGIYEDEEGPFFVATIAGVNYILNIIDSTDTSSLQEPDDLVFKNVYIKNIKYNYENDSSIEITEINI
jgi:hypothetical protein